MPPDRSCSAPVQRACLLLPAGRCGPARRWRRAMSFPDLTGTPSMTTSNDLPAPRRALAAGLVAALLGRRLSRCAGAGAGRARAAAHRLPEVRPASSCCRRRRARSRSASRRRASSVKWIEFPAGPQLLEGLNVGSIDFGTVGEAPPIFAQAAGRRPRLRRPTTRPRPQAEAIVVPKDSPIKIGGRSQGQEGRAQQGLQRALPAGARRWRSTA